jgi:putative flippase GtrA
MFCKAQLSAQVATLVDFTVSLLLKEVFGMWYVWASFLGALSGGLMNCMVNYRWVFDADGLKKKNVVVKYFVVWTGSILLNTLGTYLLTELSQQYFLFAKAVVAVSVGLLWNYQLQRLFVYRDTHIIEKIHKKKKI